MIMNNYAHSSAIDNVVHIVCVTPHDTKYAPSVTLQILNAISYSIINTAACMIDAWCIILLLTLRFVTLYCYEYYVNKRAPLIGLMIPYFGCAPLYLIAPLRFIDYCKYISGGNAFTIYLAGRYINVRLGEDFERYFYHAPESQLSFTAAAQDFFGPCLGREAFCSDNIQSFSKLRHKLLGNPSRHIDLIHSLVNESLDHYILKLKTTVVKRNLTDANIYNMNLAEYLPNLISKINISCLVGKELGKDDEFITDFTTIENGINLTSSLPPLFSSILLAPAKNAFDRFTTNVLRAINIRNNEKHRDGNDNNHDKKNNGDDLLNLIQDIHSLDERSVIAARFFAVLYAGGTTSKLISQVLTLIFQHPNILAKVKEEIASSQTDSNKLDLLHLVKKTPYFSSCIEEALRLKTGILSIRKATSTIKSKNYTIHKGELVAISPYYSHHQKKYFTNPTVFSPGSNRSNRKAPNHGWGGGKHVCAGRLFATFVAKIVIAIFLEKLNIIEVDNLNAGDDFTVPGIALCKPFLKFYIRS